MAECGESARPESEGLYVRVRSLSLIAMVVVTAVFSLQEPAHAAPSSGKARFIVTLVDGASPRAVAAEYRRDGAEVKYVYTAALNGFAGAMSDANLRSLARDRRVARVERDGVATTAGEQAGATWGLDRIDQRTGTNGSYTYTHDGLGVTAYIVDTGILYTHDDVTGRASLGYDAFGGDGKDCNGHGTHVAGTVGGSTWGAAKAATLVAVRVLDCNGSGSWSGVIAGLDWITANNGGKPAVANMSLGGGANSSVDDAVDRTINAGVTVVVAAGNGNRAGVAQDACKYSPARVPAALTIGATTSSDAKTSWSNYGDCVDFFAPGASITSAWHTSNNATNTISGTSMAAPHAAGVAALYLQQAPTAAPATVGDAIEAATTKGIVTSSKTTDNHLLYSLVVAEPATVGTLTGTVTSSTDATPISGATVAAGAFTTTSAGDGSYSLQLPTGTQTVTVTAAGFDGTSETVTIAEGSTTTHNFVLTPTSTPETVTIGLTLTKGTKSKGVTPVTATWTDSGGITGHLYDVWANGTSLATNVSGDSHTADWRGSGTHTYRVCRAGTSTCSPDVSITI